MHRKETLMWAAAAAACCEILILCTTFIYFFIIHSAGFELHLSASPSVSLLFSPFCREHSQNGCRELTSLCLTWLLAALVPPRWRCTLKSPNRGTMTWLMLGCRFSQRGLGSPGRSYDPVSLTTNHHHTLLSQAAVMLLALIGLKPCRSIVQLNKTVTSCVTPCRCHTLVGADEQEVDRGCCEKSFIYLADTSLLRVGSTLAPLSLWPENKTWIIDGSLPQPRQDSPWSADQGSW